MQWCWVILCAVVLGDTECSGAGDTECSGAGDTECSGAG